MTKFIISGSLFLAFILVNFHPKTVKTGFRYFILHLMMNTFPHFFSIPSQLVMPALIVGVIFGLAGLYYILYAYVNWEIAGN